MVESREMSWMLEKDREPAGTDVAALARRAQGGDRTAYGELFRRFWPGVHAVVLGWLRDPVEADDVAQDVFLHGMRKLRQLRDVRCFAGWLRQIAVRLALNRLSRRRPVGADLASLVNVPAAGAGPLTEVLQDEVCGKVRLTLKRLRPLDRQVLEAFYLHGLSLQEISTALDAPLGTIKRRLHTARQRMREQFEHDAGLASCPA